MGPTVWKELEKAVHDAQENKQSNAMISTTCLKHIWRELRSYHRREGILGFEEDGRVQITPERAAKIAIEMYTLDHGTRNTTFQTRYVLGTDEIIVLATRDNHTTATKYTFSKIESEHKVKIIC